jgi:hypothetical protein
MSARTRIVDELDPCGECPKGKCDRCDGCVWMTDMNAKYGTPDVRKWGAKPEPAEPVMSVAMSDADEGPA